jgi:hypothetical protein
MATLVRPSGSIGRITPRSPRNWVRAVVFAVAVGAVCFAAAFAVARSTRSGAGATGASPVRFGPSPGVKNLDRAPAFPALRRRAPQTTAAAAGPSGGTGTSAATTAPQQPAGRVGGPRTSSGGGGGSSNGQGTMLTAPPPPAGQTSPGGAGEG